MSLGKNETAVNNENVSGKSEADVKGVESQVLHSFLKNQGGLAKLVIIQDCLSQSGLPIFYQLIHQMTHCPNETQQHENVLLINTTSDFNPDSHRTREAVNAFQSIHLAQHVHYNHQKQSGASENHKFNLNDLLQLVRQAISCLDTSAEAGKSGEPLSILVDTVQELFRLFSVYQTFSFLKQLLDVLPNPESRLIVLDSPHLNLQTSNNCSTEIINPSAGLKSLALSTSHLHLRIHPTSLIDHLINDFGLPVPIQSTTQPGTHYDLRLFQLIHELASSWDPYLLGNTTTDKDELRTIPQGLLIPQNSSSSSGTNNLGTCVIEWTAKNIPSCSSRPSASIKSQSNKSKSSQKRKSFANLSSVQHGLEALQLSLNPLSLMGFQLTPVPISKIIKKRTFKLSTPSGDQTRSDSNLDPLQTPLTFNLSLTDKQRADREAVELPFLPKRSQDGSVIRAPGEMYDGSFQKNDSKPSSGRTGGMILYEPDSADDFDDEEPDDD